MAEANASQIGARNNEGRRRRILSIKATWSAGGRDGGVEERGAAAGERRLEAMRADDAVGIKTDLSQIAVEGKVDGAAGGSWDGLTEAE